MCEFCGCRRQASIDELSAEHDRLLDLVYGLRRDADRGDHRTVVATLESTVGPLLRHHTDKEERGLFARLRDAWEADDRLSALVAEHRDIERLLATITRGGADWVADVRRLGDALAEHIFDEETDLFPYALFELDDEDWARVEAVHDAASTRDRAGAVDEALSAILRRRHVGARFP